MRCPVCSTPIKVELVNLTIDTCSCDVKLQDTIHATILSSILAYWRAKFETRGELYLAHGSHTSDDKLEYNPNTEVYSFKFKVPGTTKYLTGTTKLDKAFELEHLVWSVEHEV